MTEENGFGFEKKPNEYQEFVGRWVIVHTTMNRSVGGLLERLEEENIVLSPHYGMSYDAKGQPTPMISNGMFKLKTYLVGGIEDSTKCDILNFCVYTKNQLDSNKDNSTKPNNSTQ